MKALIVYASRYGSTATIGRWIAERLRYEGIDINLRSASDDVSLNDYRLVILGSGIYNHGVLPELRSFVEDEKDILRSKKVAIFGVAMRTTPVFKNGKVHGGLEHLMPQIEMLGRAVIHVDMLHGEMVPQKMTERDRESLLKLYKILSLSDDEMQRRLTPRTLMDKKEAWEFAEAIIKKVKNE